MVVVVFLYQKFFSPDHSFWGKKFFPHGYCPFYPSCSEYGKVVVQKRGVIHGIPRMLWRILRCHPWTKGGMDMP
ncbi:MAG: membrane protein insertion efficiency factor YidD [Candidatus Magasanikbacteria bacterium]|uniref:Membrane protein insertion efficiency factor YidD n=1 Tax=Candidatus Magasanikbacteria bacterium CG10_big_fil_rev_8_21_14_0_10_38_6 TaxID=1974647 RepID=A0A2M6P1K0_9BACT|nr:membrane protein insertion efficiency factor YidD [Candidatus Magasanikbacteria bacterium]NCS72053.1 membrane protein insertion efficiency factor YidD [Candidatus Magasanikbacteria bacterium]PIR77602.1 MAG: membrane protein insertion efficiency factor YidD [Candidatus Magasanikbacteria bacterium CG10_big_fil_rev_8_21_14_0_10_38_6]